MNLNEYLDYNLIKIKSKEPREFIGVPIVVNYADETESGENEIVVENDEEIREFRESIIMAIEILKK